MCLNTHFSRNSLSFFLNIDNRSKKRCPTNTVPSKNEPRFKQRTFARYEHKMAVTLYSIIQSSSKNSYGSFHTLVRISKATGGGWRPFCSLSGPLLGTDGGSSLAGWPPRSASRSHMSPRHNSAPSEDDLEKKQLIRN